MPPSATITLPFTFTNDTTAYADQMMSQLTTIRDAFNTHTHLDLPDGLLNGLKVGNDLASDYGPNTGTPPGNVIPIKFQVLKGTPGVDLAQTQQGGVAWTKYRTRCIDDASESWSFGVLATDAWGPWPGPQTQPVTGLEGDALLQGAVVVNGKTVAVVGGVQIQNTAHSDDAISFYSAQTNVVGTVTNRYGFFDEGTTGAGTITNNWSFYGRKRIQTEDSLIVGAAGANATLSTVWIQGNPNGAHVVVVAAGAGTQNLQEWRNSGNTAIAFMQQSGALMLAGTVSITGTKLGIRTGADTNQALVLQWQNATQSGDMLRIQTDAGVILTAFDKDGKLVFGPSGSQDTNLYRVGANSLKTDDAFTVSLALTANGGLTLADATDITIGTGTGTKIGQTTSKISFYGATPVSRSAAYTQTYATTTRTHSNPTATALTDAFGTADGTIADVGAAFSQATLNNNFQDVSTAINAAIVDIANVKQLVNSVIDDLQANGLLQ
jgi:hypothetical protein